MSRLYLRDRMNWAPMARVFMRGPRWRRHFGIVAETLRAPEPGRPLQQRTYLFYDFAADVRELVLEQIRFDVFAEWSDPRERFNLPRAQRRNR